MTNINRENRLFGIELEFGNVDNSKELPNNWGRTGDPDVMNTKPYKLACDPEYKDCNQGAEFNAEPLPLNELKLSISNLLDYYPERLVTHREVTHSHISWQGMADDLEGLQKYLKYSVECNDWIINNIYNHNLDIDYPNMPGKTRRFFSFDKVAIPEYKYKYAKVANTIQEFKDAFARQINGKINHLSIRRYYVNVYNALKNGGYSIEHRHFFPSTDLDSINSTLDFVNEFADNAFSNNPQPIEEWGSKYISKVPTFVPFDLELEHIWEQTNYKYNDRKEVNEVRDMLIKNYHSENDLS